MKAKPIRLILFILLLAFVIIQFIPVDRSLPESDPNQNFMALIELDEDHVIQLKQACFDCHSNHSRYPWYGYVAPASFVVQHHIDEGREELNFDEWGTYSKDKQKHKLEEISESLRDNWMPLAGYEKLHKSSQLSERERESLAKAIDKIRSNL